ncbi:hypothetical protein A3C23_01075 [Candidatus Roizmanbacteria bacterium RIFCSPHIGHO2_02_FULL_37_13b]|uniref:Iron ABC transporter ATP-binding protein n=1 Tax=Candidatus Roizmanbacteria bacterium RIFCSPLOWO2_02_FULL_36_11 TaxID=1802071 RepID=A0A1F7JIV0_9BACT|nr:MAG: hypothetical protein A3C23_01075 [Candidatus Roizmanbacteria bacterium RIFCSPHIGHO2_02_FULL_37_13b]OGK55516.1 MAG: hypothetical protein A3H78_05110 [Candidatus Roizmanbacteria bacterium RIFCSPLOWO2_02_FULL_36_11]
MKNITKIIKISKPLHRLIFILSVLVLITSSLELVSPILSKLVVDEIVLKVQKNTGDVSWLMTLIVIAFIVSLLNTVLMSVSNRIGDHFSGLLRKFLTEKFYTKVLTLPQSYFDSEISGKIVNQLNRGIMSIYGFMNTATNFILPMLIQSFFTILVLAYYNLPIAFLTLILFPIFMGLSFYSTVKWGREEVKKNKLEDISRGRIQEVISNIKLVKSFLMESKEYELISGLLTKINRIYAKQSNTFHLFDFARNTSLHLILFGINLIVFYNTFKGALTIGEMVLILQLVNQARRPLFGMSFILTQVQAAESGSKEFFEILQLPSKEIFKTKRSIDIIKYPSVVFNQVSFQYEKSQLVLNQASFVMKTKEKVALVGESGAGKTTIVNLILKFYKPSSGQILIGDKDYQRLNHIDVRQLISLVFQDSELFSSTVLENVCYGTTANETEVIKALKLANAYEFVKKLPQGIHSEVGERGIRLSGGQKQRIQIARAILKNSPILILDEATSSLDAKSEKEVQDALEKLMENKLVIIVAHRFSTIQNVDKIIVIEDGRIVDVGTPQGLSKKTGLYSSLLQFQMEGNKKLLEKFEIY